MQSTDKYRTVINSITIFAFNINPSISTYKEGFVIEVSKKFVQDMNTY